MDEQNPTRDPDPGADPLPESAQASAGNDPELSAPPRQVSSPLEPVAVDPPTAAPDVVALEAAQSPTEWPTVAQVQTDPYGWYAQHERMMAAHAAQRAAMLRRLQVVLLASLAAFCVVAWMLVRTDNAVMTWLGWSGPSRTVRQHLEALSRGEAREAYAYFTVKYRGEIPLRAYERLVTSHRAMFRTHVLSIATPTQDGDVAVLDTRLAAASGTHYRARFTLVRVEGRWMIDQIRWSEAPSPSSFTRT